jgi:putative tricarboxylic transport membrane protein
MTQDADSPTETPRKQAAIHRWISIAVPLALGAGWAGYAITAFRVGRFSAPGPALWPLIVGSLLMVLSLVRILVDRDTTGYEPYRRTSALVAVGAGVTGVFIVAFTLIGFLISCFVLVLFWTRTLGGESWRLSLIVATSSAVALQLIFGTLLGVPFSPLGPS